MNCPVCTQHAMNCQCRAEFHGGPVRAALTADPIDTRALEPAPAWFGPALHVARAIDKANATLLANIEAWNAMTPFERYDKAVYWYLKTGAIDTHPCCARAGGPDCLLEGCPRYTVMRTLGAIEPTECKHGTPFRYPCDECDSALMEEINRRNRERPSEVRAPRMWSGVQGDPFRSLRRTETGNEPWHGYGNVDAGGA